METESYKLIGLQVDGMRKLRAINMKFAPSGLIPIIGKNKMGKTTILESLAVLIGGKKYLKDGAINPDADRMTLVGQVGEYEIYREYRIDKDSVLKVTGKGGKILQGRVADFLTAMINDLTFSPFPFIQKTPLEKLRFLMKLYNIDFSEINAKLKILEDDRLFTGRKVKEFGVLIEPERVDHINMDDLLNRRKVLTDKNAVLKAGWDVERAGKKKEIDLFNEVMRSRSALISRLKATAENIQERASLLQNTDPISSLQKSDIPLQVSVFKDLHLVILDKIEQLPQVEPEKILDLFAVPEPQYYSLVEIDEEIQLSEANNLKARIYSTYLNRLSEKKYLIEEYKDLDDKINALRDEKLAILAAIDTKVEGLTIGLESIFYNLVDTENLSDAENMTLSLKLCAAMQPSLRAVFIDRGESIDEGSRKSLHNWAVENDIQLIMSIVDEIPEEKEEGCFYIEEGQLV
jgi:hypothetical protein